MKITIMETVLSAANVSNMWSVHPFPRYSCNYNYIRSGTAPSTIAGAHRGTRGACRALWEDRMARTQSNLSDANRELQQTLTRSEPRIAASYALVGAILLFGGAGYALDRWLDTSPWILAGGLLMGLGIGFANLALSLRRR